MRNHIGKLVNAAALSILLAGCVTTGNKIDQSVVQTFQPGVTTIADVKSKLGEPTQTMTNSDGTVTLMYMFAHSQVSGSSFIPVVGPLVSSSKTDSQMTELSFDRNGKYTRSTMTDGSSTTGYNH